MFHSISTYLVFFTTNYLICLSEYLVYNIFGFFKVVNKKQILLELEQINKDYKCFDCKTNKFITFKN